MQHQYSSTEVQRENKTGTHHGYIKAITYPICKFAISQTNGAVTLSVSQNLLAGTSY